jgi:hypothetical protein
MRHGKNQRDFFAILVFRHQHDRAGLILSAFFLVSGGRLAPQKRLVDDEARNR